MTIYIDFIADYGVQTGYDDLAFSEVCLRLTGEFAARTLDFPLIKSLSVNPFNTIETGFVVAQLAFNSLLGEQHIVYHNTAPRKDALAGRIDNEGEFLAVAELPNKVRIIGVFGGYTFSFLKGVCPVYKVKCARAGSQFRSRDVFPPCVASLAAHQRKPLSTWELLGEEVMDIPSIPENTVVSIDGYGNIKTNIPYDAAVTSVTLNNVTKEVTTGGGIFSAPDGTLIFATGSSGFNGLKCTEICLRGGNARRLFNNPLPGAQIKIG